ncbi:hypothetical protein NC653_022911 [Populus alba x Populus x berolinensis]|uniref:Uncharacterized protein n=1 Tax=Populus alba x Populus x berolinensis TaxID=444605 RepID=A0AAD6MFT6_9ROSI|nr:hypothetical protein NC653_022911 [Populus alba x Populus x berolinensis]
MYTKATSLDRTLGFWIFAPHCCYKISTLNSNAFSTFSSGIKHLLLSPSVVSLPRDIIICLSNGASNNVIVIEVSGLPPRPRSFLPDEF